MRPPSPSARAALSALAALGALASAGCGQSAVADVKPGARATPLATVNGVAISLLPTPAAAANGANAPNAAGAAARLSGTVLTAEDKLRLEALIDSQLLQEQARRERLDRDPLVQQAIARATADVLAEASLQRQLARLPAPTPAQIDAYFRAHPELFAGRKLFYIKQLVLDTAAFTPALKQVVDHAASLEQVAQWLDAHRVRYERAQLARSSAELAPELLAQLKTMRVRQLFVVAAGAQTMVDLLADVTPVPMTAAQAAPQIDAYLRAMQRKQAGDTTVARLRAHATISYVNPPRTLATTNPHPMESQ